MRCPAQGTGSPSSVRALRTEKGPDCSGPQFLIEVEALRSPNPGRK